MRFRGKHEKAGICINKPHWLEWMVGVKNSAWYASPSKRVAWMGLLFALAVALSAMEGMLPPVIPVPGIKLGLSNLVTMYCLFLLGSRQALLVAALKSLSVLLTRGWTASLLSLWGGLASVLVMVCLLRLSGRRAGIGPVSIAGAIFHNVGQLAAAAVLLNLGAVLRYYLPILIAAGAGMGLLTSMLFRLILPFLRKTGLPCAIAAE